MIGALETQIDALQLKIIGFDASQLRTAGFGALALKTAGFDASQLKAAGFGALALKMAGFDASQLKAAGVGALALKTAGFDALELKLAGFDALELKLAGFDALELKTVKFDALKILTTEANIMKLKHAGFNAKKISDAYLSLIQKRDHVYLTVGKTLQQADKRFIVDSFVTNYHHLMRLKSQSKAESKSQYKKCIEVCGGKLMSKTHFVLYRLLSAGFTLQELKEAGFTAQDLESAALIGQELIINNFKVMELYFVKDTRANYKRGEVTEICLGQVRLVTVNDLISAGYKFNDIRGCRFTKSEIANQAKTMLKTGEYPPKQKLELEKMQHFNNSCSII